MVKVKTKMNHRAIQKVSVAQIRALEQVVDGKTEGILTEIANEQVVPKQTGELERGAWVDKTGLKRGKVKIVYDTPYARRLYWHPEYRFRQDKNRNARGLWLDPWVKGEKTDSLVSRFKKLVKRLAGGFIK
ncbi:hypothetical protein M5X17_10450 [Paenibacillus alvei]|uniref:hypothetical protein n=1 Tax=Paenibacillus alvei TaxID=44250 RepID=UPI00228190D7|nr:hypothetical protein [Paenibacillus alvei]MCY9734167.1 hypothetical protein [Paenibacillus alvei]